jgi:hypothetical protein
MCRDTAVHFPAVRHVRHQAARLDPVALHDHCRKPPLCGKGDHRLRPRRHPAGRMQQRIGAPVDHFLEGRNRIIIGAQKKKPNLDAGLLRGALGLLNITEGARSGTPVGVPQYRDAADRRDRLFQQLQPLRGGFAGETRAYGNISARVREIGDNPPTSGST